jgi:hypothetical protein
MEGVSQELSGSIGIFVDFTAASKTSIAHEGEVIQLVPKIHSNLW